MDRWRGQVQNFDLDGRSDAGHILQPQKQTHYEMQINRDFTLSPENQNVLHGISWTPANTKKSLRTISRLKTLSKHGGFLLSHLVWQYHRR